MPQDAQYHELRAAQELAIASACLEGDVRQRHLELAERHADAARLIAANSVFGSARIAADGTSTVINQSREVIQKSYSILAESRSNVSTRAPSGFS